MNRIIRWLIILILIIYVISPIDIIPDVIPIIGWIDDIIAIIVVYYNLR